MKIVLVATFIFGLYVGISGSGGSFTPSKVVSQHCGANGKAEIVFFNSVHVAHPLGKNTCGNMHSIDKVGLDGKG